MFRDARIHVVIPAYNVADPIADVIKNLPAGVDPSPGVDDAPADATAAAALAVGDPRVTVIRHAVNQGGGAATISGFGEALRRGDDIAAKMDGDGQMDPAHLPRLLTPIIDGRCDYTKGNRFLFENDMLINLNIFNVRVMDIALPARYGRERSSMSVGRILCSFPLHLFRGYWYRFYRKHVLRDFSPVALFMLTGLPLFAFGTCFGAYTWLQSYLHNQFASTGTVMLSVLPFIVGFELILQALVLEIRETLQSQPSAALRLPPGSSSNVRPSSPSG